MTVRRLVLAGASLCLGLLLLYWSFGSSRFAAGDREFVLESDLMKPWAQTWIVRGDTARFRDMDSAAAMDSYWQAVGRNPLLFGGWFALARLELRQGETPRAEALREFLLDNVPPSTAWRWHQLLLASDSDDDARFGETFNFVLERLPRHRQEAVELALNFWGDWPSVLERTASANRWTVFQECMNRRAVDASLELYPVIEADPEARPDAAGQLRFIEFLLRNKRWADAVDVWDRSSLSDGALVANGSFEEPLMGMAFGWRQGRPQGIEIRRDGRRHKDRGHVMRFHLLGTANVRFDHFWQYVPLKPGTSYELRFAWKGERLSTDRGLFMEVRGVDCPGLRVQVPERTGSWDWQTETLAFETPEECLMGRVGLRRNESLKFDNKIAGDLWIDAVELVQTVAKP
jgi:hypothetical protein